MGGSNNIYDELIESALSVYMKPYGFHAYCISGMALIELQNIIRMSFPIEERAGSKMTVADLAIVIAEFITTCYKEDRMMTVDSVEKLIAMPVRIEFLSDSNLHLYLRIALIAAESRFGKSKIKEGKFINDNTIVLITRGGRFYVGITDFRKNLIETLERMGHFMRKPLRKKFDDICEEKKSEKE